MVNGNIEEQIHTTFHNDGGESLAFTTECSTLIQGSRHPAAIERTPPWHEELRNVRAPALIIHGTEDPIFPVSHANRMAELLPDAKILWLEGVGHELPPGSNDLVIEAILEHTR